MSANVKELFMKPKQQNEIEIAAQREKTAIEVQKFQQMVNALGSNTIEALASAGNNHQIKMLQEMFEQFAYYIRIGHATNLGPCGSNDF